MCQEKKADAPTAEIVNDLSLEKEVLDVTYNENKVVKHEKDIETEMDNTEPNPRVGHRACCF